MIEARHLEVAGISLSARERTTENRILGNRSGECLQQRTESIKFYSINLVTRRLEYSAIKGINATDITVKTKCLFQNFLGATDEVRERRVALKEEFLKLFGKRS
jgi:hypothetical protein